MVHLRKLCPKLSIFASRMVIMTYAHSCRVYITGNEADLSSLDDPVYLDLVPY
jgi:hypothetical protein